MKILFFFKLINCSVLFRKSFAECLCPYIQNTLTVCYRSTFDCTEEPLFCTVVCDVLLFIKSDVRLAIDLLVFTIFPVINIYLINSTELFI